MYAVTLLYTLMNIIFTVTAAAAATLVSSNPSEPDLGKLNAGNLILLRNGQPTQVFSRSEFNNSIDGVPIATVEQYNAKANISKSSEPTQTIEKRCPQHTIWTLNPVEIFYDWDIPMSGVVRAPDHASVMVNIDAGYRLDNSLAVSSARELKAVKTFLLKSLDILTTSSWSTSYSTGYTFYIPAGKYGVIVSNPLTTRHSGYMDVGCIGNAQRIEFSSDSYSSSVKKGSAPVEGLIGLCTGDTYPLQRCYGNGTL